MKTYAVRTVVSTTALCVGALGSVGWASMASAAAKTPAPTISAKQKAAVIAWVSAHSSAFTKLESGFDKASKAASATKVTALHNDCVSLKNTIVKVKALPPIPDATIEAMFKSSLANLLAGTKDCVAGTSASGNLNPTLLKKASKAWTTGGNQLLKVAQDFDSLV